MMGKTQITSEPGVPFIDVTREFDAPRDLIFRAHTDPELLTQWLGPRKYKMIVERLDVRDGGTWRYIHLDGSGNEHAFHGVFHGTPTPDSMVQTFEYEGAPGHVSLDAMKLEDRNGRTVIRGRSVFQSVEDRDAMIQAGMEGGMNEGYDRLDELVARLASAVS
jgi:uncharacterized protein YndB with AHSA1/START domain